jgi:hypothetical protein
LLFFLSFLISTEIKGYASCMLKIHSNLIKIFQEKMHKNWFSQVESAATILLMILVNVVVWPVVGHNSNVVGWVVGQKLLGGRVQLLGWRLDDLAERRWMHIVAGTFQEWTDQPAEDTLLALSLGMVWGWWWIG